MTDVELAYRKAEISKERKMCKHNHLIGYIHCSNCERACAFEFSLMGELLENPDMTYAHAFKLVRKY